MCFYFVGTYANYRFTPESQGVLDHASLYAPLTTVDAFGRRLMIGWIREERGDSDLRRAGWAGAQSIPRVLSLDSRSRLIMTLVPELNKLRDSQHHYAMQSLDGEITLGVRGWALEVEAEFALGDQGLCTVTVAASVDGRERTDVSYDAASQRLIVRTVTQAGGQERAVSHPLDAHENLALRMLLDGSLLEIIANGRTSLTHRFYAADRSNDGVRLSGAGPRRSGSTCGKCRPSGAEARSLMGVCRLKTRRDRESYSGGESPQHFLLQIMKGTAA
ncbi:MAG: GH32 C-terminal domain-containing protein [Chloroflexi bacterium]|nr:GH32 C-terminal domain-containing protein [Chloroflexota bacterium]